MDKIKKRLFKNIRAYNGLLLIIFTTILFFITIHRTESNKLNLQVGDIASEDIRATKDLEDIIGTEELRKSEMNKVSPKYKIQPSIQMSMKATIKDFLDTARDIKAQEDISLSKKSQLLYESQNLDLTNKETSIVLEMDYKSLNDFENNLMDLINYLMGTGIKESELEYEKENLKGTFDSLNMKEEEKAIGLKLISSTIQANEFLDKEQTNRKKEEVANSIETIILKENEIIAPKGSTIGQREISLIEESGLLRNDKSMPISKKLGLSILILLGISMFSLYIYYFNNEIIYDNKLTILVIVLVFIIIISNSLYTLSPYIMPISAAALLISILIDPKLALFANLFVTFFLGFILRLDNSIIIMYILGGSIGAVVGIKHEQRYNIFLTGIIIGFINLLSLSALGLAKGLDFIVSIKGGGYSFLSGILSAVLALGTLPILENFFMILTPLRLLELSNPNQPLLKKLLLEAPGTYHHSILVANLAEAAAEAISANPLLARVGSYYHDIGKTLRPYYFAENQFGMENPHDKLDPLESAEIILSHTTEGIKLAREYKVPNEIIAMIDQHHGTTTVAYFYHKEKELNKNSNVSIEEFRYKGKKPETKEAAIIMLADSSEAAVRSIKNLTKDKIEDMVKKVVKSKIDDGQFEECHITLKEVEIIINSFINVLTGIYHDRIEYPNIEKIEETME